MDARRLILLAAALLATACRNPQQPAPGGSGPARFIPPPHPGRWTQRPTPDMWRGRDLGGMIQREARRSSLPVTPVQDDVRELKDAADYPSGWKAYAFTVPPRDALHVRLEHPNEGWFRLVMTDRWGNLGAGMLQNVIPTGNPEVRYRNPGDSPQVVYVIADDPGWMSSKDLPYTLRIQRGEAAPAR